MYHSNRFLPRKPFLFVWLRRDTQSAPPALPALWPLCRESAATLCSRCVPLLAVGWMGFAGVPTLAALITLVLSLAGALGNGAASGQFDRLPDALVIVYAAAFVIAGAVTRGAITWLALHPESTMQEAWRAAGLRMPALLITSLGYTLCMALGAAGLAVWLRAWRIDSDMLVQPPTPAYLQRAVLAQVADALLPDPIATHMIVFPRLRSFAYTATVQADLLRRLRSNKLKGSVVMGVPLRYAPASLEFTLIPLAGLLLVIAGEALWRSRIVMVMSAECGEIIQPITRTLHFGATHFGTLLVRVWALRLIVAVACIAGVMLPCMMASSQVVPALAKVLGAPALYPLCAFALSAGVALVCALFTTFSVIFDVKLVAAIESSSR